MRLNNFDVLRLFAALLVLWDHSYPLTGKSGDEIFGKLLGYYDGGGGLGVTVFFVISGFLVTKSAFERPSLDYLLARSLRILPGLAFAVLATVFVVGPLLTRMPVVDYFRDPSTFSYLRNILVFGIQYNLADAASTLPSHAINGSLWTLSVECGFYIILVLLVRLNIYQRRTAPLVVAIAIAAFIWGIYGLGLSQQASGHSLWNGAPLYWVLKYGLAFTLSSAFWIYRDRIPLDAGLATACVIALFAACGTMTAPLVYLICVPYVVLYLALGLPWNISLTDTIGDLSYGIYLFAFPLQQLTISAIGPNSPTAVSLVATVLSIGAAAISWRFVEKPCLSLKQSTLALMRRSSLRVLPDDRKAQMDSTAT